MNLSTQKYLLGTDVESDTIYQYFKILSMHEKYIQYYSFLFEKRCIRHVYVGYFLYLFNLILLILILFNLNITQLMDEKV